MHPETNPFSAEAICKTHDIGISNFLIMAHEAFFEIHPEGLI